LVVNPSLLHSMQFAFLSQALNGDDLLTRRHRHRVRARTNGFAIEQDCARSALGDTAPKFRSFDVELVTQRPQQGHLGFDIERMALSID
jgi:truncated hemoglobin YjbI